MFTIRNLLCRVGVIDGRSYYRTAVLSPIALEAIYYNTCTVGTHAGEEGEVGEVTVAQKASFVLRHTIADLHGRIDLWG